MGGGVQEKKEEKKKDWQLLILAPVAALLQSNKIPPPVSFLTREEQGLVKERDVSGNEKVPAAAGEDRMGRARHQFRILDCAVGDERPFPACS